MNGDVAVESNATLSVTLTDATDAGNEVVKVAAKTVAVRYLTDRDGDGKTDGSYSGTFLRPRTRGTCGIVVRFKGSTSSKPSSWAQVLTLPAS